MAKGITEELNEQTEFITDIREVVSKQKKYKIMIPSTEREKDAVQVGINGYVYNIPRDKTVEVPEAVIEVLNNAVYTVYTQKKRDEGEGDEWISNEVRRFAYQSMD